MLVIGDREMDSRLSYVIGMAELGSDSISDFVGVVQSKETVAYRK